ncbi:hypothetical protein [Atlantibacter hermannii]|nr:hypothetical protein [Atlantibacter hermannii]
MIKLAKQIADTKQMPGFADTVFTFKVILRANLYSPVKRWKNELAAS